MDSSVTHTTGLGRNNVNVIAKQTITLLDGLSIHTNSSPPRAPPQLLFSTVPISILLVFSPVASPRCTGANITRSSAVGLVAGTVTGTNPPIFLPFPAAAATGTIVTRTTAAPVKQRTHGVHRLRCARHAPGRAAPCRRPPGRRRHRGILANGDEEQPPQAEEAQGGEPGKLDFGWRGGVHEGLRKELDPQQDLHLLPPTPYPPNQKNMTTEPPDKQQTDRGRQKDRQIATKRGV